MVGSKHLASPNQKSSKAKKIALGSGSASLANQVIYKDCHAPIMMSNNISDFDGNWKHKGKSPLPFILTILISFLRM